VPPTVRSWAVDDLYPKSLIIEGRNREIPYRGQVMPQYTLPKLAEIYIERIDTY
jgi:hypothetical protein